MLRSLPVLFPVLFALAACGGDSSDAAGTASGDTSFAQPPSRPTVAAYVNEIPITESEVEERILAVVKQRTGDQPAPGILQQASLSLRPQIIEQLIGEVLLDAAVDAAGITVTDEEVRAEMDRNVRTYLFQSNMTEEQFAAQVLTFQEVSLDQYIADQAAEPEFRRFVFHTRWLAQEYPEETTVSDEAIQERYEQQRDTLFTRPELVRASHILIKSTNPAGTADPQEALERAEELVVLAREPGADFAALARDHSEGPSAPLGGDLGYFARSGAMVEPFAAAAFELEEGVVSDVVESQFGYHVILVTDKREAKVYALEEVEDFVRNDLEKELAAIVRNLHVAKLREGAEIRYP